MKRLYGRVLPLRMLFQSNLLRFHHLDSFKDFCGNRVSLPANRMHELPSLGKGDLQQQLDMLKEARQRLLKCLITTELQPGLYLPEARIFSKDNAWRDVMRALRGATGGRRLHAGAVRLALLYYLQYLGRREDSLSLVLLGRAEDDLEQTLNQPPPPHLEELALDLEEPPRQGSALSDGHVAANMAPPMEAPMEMESENKKLFQRLPRGMGVSLKLQSKEPIKILLSSHPCRLELGQEPCFVDVDGVSHRLAVGRTSVGRDRSNEIVLDPTLRDISRVHLVIEYLGASHLQFFDFSSYGTYLPRHLKWHPIPASTSSSRQKLSSLH